MVAVYPYIKGSVYIHSSIPSLIISSSQFISVKAVRIEADTFFGGGGFICFSC